MRPTFLLNAKLKAVSALVNKDAGEGLEIGISAELVKDFETPYGMIAAGTKGFIDYVDPESGLIEILMEGMEPALIHWGNMLVLVPFQTDELTDSLLFALRQVTSVLQEKGLALVPQLLTG